MPIDERSNYWRYTCDACGNLSARKDGLEFVYSPVFNYWYVYCAACQQEDIPAVRVERHGFNPYS